MGAEWTDDELRHMAQAPETAGPVCGGCVRRSDEAPARFENVSWANAFHEVRDVD